MKKQTGIMFRPEMIKAIISGLKTQTRRLLTPQPKTLEYKQKSRCGEPDDFLYVKEKWAWNWQDPERQEEKTYALYRLFPNYVIGSEKKWISPMFMPKAAADIWLEITALSVERLGDISEADAVAEGVEAVGKIFGEETWRDYSGEEACFFSAIASYASLWESINGIGSWRQDKNKLVWKISFSRVEKS